MTEELKDVNLVTAVITDYSDKKIIDGYVWTINDYFMEIKYQDTSKQYPVEPDTKVKVFVTTPPATEVCYFALVDSVKNRTIKLKIRHKVFSGNKREFFRVETNIPAVIEQQLFCDCKINLEKPQNITIKNISCGGIMFKSSLKFEKDCQYVTRIRLGPSTIEVEFKILNIINLPDEHMFCHCCAFTKTSAHMQDIISSYVNRMQVEYLMKLDKL